MLASVKRPDLRQTHSLKDETAAIVPPFSFGLDVNATDKSGGVMRGKF
jgi:hypothetical protein